MVDSAFAPPEGFEKKNDTDTSFLTGLDEALANVKESDRTAIKEIYRLLDDASESDEPWS